MALTALYEADQRGWRTLDIEPTHPAKAIHMIQGVAEHLKELDDAIDGVSTRWRVVRMPPVDRAISPEPSVEPLSTISHWAGRIRWPISASARRGRLAASFRAAVITQ